MSKRRVVITGIGMVSPVGNSASESWGNIISGKSGVSNISKFETEGFETKFAATVNFDPENYLDKKDIRRVDEFIQFGLIASDECIKDSGLNLEKEDLNKIGVSIGSGIGGLGTIEDNKIDDVLSDEKNLSDEIEKLNQLLKDGVLTQEEFEKAKKKLLDN